MTGKTALKWILYEWQLVSRKKKSTPKRKVLIFIQLSSAKLFNSE